MPPLAIAETGGILRCERVQVDLSGSASVGEELQFLWMTTNGGNILSGDSTAFAVVDEPGEYILEVTDLNNGCIHFDTVTVIEQENPLETVHLTILAECDNDGNGSVMVDSVSFADVPVTFSLNNSVPQGSASFGQLQGGEYTLTVEDTFGCRLDTLIEIPDIEGDFFIDLGPDREIYLGDTVHLLANTNLDTSFIQSLTWKPSPDTSCFLCLDAVYQPLQTMPVSITLIMEQGCMLEDKVVINVKEKARAFVPNIFSPNNDGINDILEVFIHDGVSRILHFGVYDRWGNKVFGVEGVDNSPGSIQWDGFFQGKQLPPSVFAYILELELINGKKEILSGDITLIR